MRRYEAELFSRFHETYVVTQADRAALLGLNPALNVKVIPLGVEPIRVPSRAPMDQRPPILLFTGAMWATVNVVASTFLCERVLPLVQSQVPDVQLYIVGRDPHLRIKELARRYQGVTVTGYVEDLASYLQMADVYVCPLLTATGIQNRVLEAMAAGRAIVCTSTVAERLEVNPGEHLLVADSPEGFAEHVVRLLKSPELRETMGKAAQAVTREKYTWEAMAKSVLALYQETLVAARAGRGDS